MERIRLGKQIGTGYFRDCYEVAGNPTLCAKVIRDRVEAPMLEDLLGVKTIPGWFASLLVFGRLSVNKVEMRNFRSLPESLKTYVPQNARLAKLEDGRKVLVSERVMDSGDKPAQTMLENGPVQNARFWEHMDTAVREMKEKNAQFLDILPQNIMIRKTSPSEWVPVLIDVKYLRKAPLFGNFPGKLFLDHSKKLRNQRVDRQYRELKAVYLPRP